MGASECVSSMAFFLGFHSSSEDRAIRLLLIAKKEKCRKERYEKSERRKEREMCIRDSDSSETESRRRGIPWRESTRGSDHCSGIFQ